MKNTYLFFGALAALAIHTVVQCQHVHGNDIIWYPVDEEDGVFVSIYGEKYRSSSRSSGKSYKAANAQPKIQRIPFTLPDNSEAPFYNSQRSKRQIFFDEPFPPFEFPHNRFPNGDRQSDSFRKNFRDTQNFNRYPSVNELPGQGFLNENFNGETGSESGSKKRKRQRRPNKPGRPGGNRPNRPGNFNNQFQSNGPNSPYECNNNQFSQNGQNRPNVPGGLNCQYPTTGPNYPTEFNNNQYPQNGQNRPSRPGGFDNQFPSNENGFNNNQYPQNGQNRPMRPNEFDNQFSQVGQNRPNRPGDVNNQFSGNNQNRPNPPSGFNNQFPMGTGQNRPTRPNRPQRPESSTGSNNEASSLVFPGDGNSATTTTSTTTTTSRPMRGTTTMSPCERSCPVTPEFNPVCGTDSFTYSNIGRLRCAQSCGKNVSLSHYGNCGRARLVTPIQNQ